MPQTVWIARHGNRIDFVNPDWFLTAEHRYDPHLSEDGHIQAKQLADRLKGEGISHIFASPFLRTVQTANHAAEALDLSIKLEWGLCEWLNPEWMTEMPETESVADLCRRFPRIDAAYKGGIASYPETGEACLKRAGETAKRLAAEFPEDMLLVGHGASVLGSAIGLAGGAETEINASLCCLVKVVREDVQWSIELNGDTSHLTDAETAIRFN
ncbi:histidine phosphatase family protein [Microcoleus sp. LEGE 07076]|uniref:histidine phosphatase family protein n=1 Tax=Microcoleus sp. LEGE 07076 TaxID=915322 RepID=UPI00187FF2F1|nr:histidine phosphatase family protein [Microcoleus sp. LEGE 07076]MBE9184319.1 histidine phosphatase family protein [Microcoleus sp. LEGE 07076]